MSKFVQSLTLSVVLSTALTLGACQPTPTPSPEATGITADDLVGLWVQPLERVASIDYALLLNEDGTYRAAMTLFGLDKIPADIGQWQLEGTVFTFVSSRESVGCPGQSGRYDVELTEQGHLRFILRDDPCQLRSSRVKRRPFVLEKPQEQ